MIVSSLPAKKGKVQREIHRYLLSTTVIGNRMFALFRHHDQLHLLQAEPALIGAATDECLRYDCPGR